MCVTLQDMFDPQHLLNPGVILNQVRGHCDDLPFIQLVLKVAHGMVGCPGVQSNGSNQTLHCVSLCAISLTAALTVWWNVGSSVTVWGPLVALRILGMIFKRGYTVITHDLFAAPKMVMKRAAVDNVAVVVVERAGPQCAHDVSEALTTSSLAH
jgi:hypothetical protein